ncbi:MAG: hypothetical protein AAFR98_11105 [Pseudomonadota bacterium]
MSLNAMGYQVFDHDEDLLRWVNAAAPIARDLAANPDLQDQWLRHGHTWFAGVNVFPNDATGSWPGGPSLSGASVEAARALCPFEIAWDTAQISIPYRGYPKQDAGESDANHRFRKNRDAAHLDGLLPVGPNRRRFMQEFHAFVLGLPLNASPKEAAPLVVWEGSHTVIQDWLRSTLAVYPKEQWKDVDLTDTYQEVRRHIFDTCPRVTLSVLPGSSYLVHRFALHGVAPWDDALAGPMDGRIIAYFRPHWRGDLQHWLSPA